jgi:hypothetical protein
MSRIRSEYADAPTYGRVRLREEPNEDEEEEEKKDEGETEEGDDDENRGYSV